MVRFSRFASVPFLLLAASVASANPFASSVVDFSQGVGGSPTYANPDNALGSPIRFTGTAFGFPSVVSPFGGPFDPTDIVSIGAGGFLTVKFDAPVVDDPLNPFGIDLLIFGNSFYEDLDYPNGLAGGLFADRATIEVSADGVDWRTIPLLTPDGRFPTLGYADSLTPYDTVPGLVETDFTRPVNPAFNPTGKTFHEIVAGYDGSGGGTGVDLAAVSLSSISFVRVSRDASLPGKFEIDAFADVSAVPSPGGAAMIALGVALRSRRRR